METASTGNHTQLELLHLLVSIQEEERRRISRDLHDETGQTITALTILLKMVQSELPRENSDLHGWLETALELSEAASEQIHLIIQDLRPPALDVIGIQAALEELCFSFQRNTRIQMDVRISNLADLPDPYSISLYRCLQEALTNVVRHAHAQQIWVDLKRIDSGWILTVKDDGIGMSHWDGASPVEDTRRWGLVGLRERTRLLGGQFEVESPDGQGTCLTITLPAAGFDAGGPIQDISPRA